MASRFVRPDTTTLKISQGDTLTVKRRLTSGEQRAMYARMYLAGADGSLKVNPLETGIALIAAYLLDWSLTDEDGRLVVIRDQPLETVLAALNMLGQESFTEILKAIQAHEAAMLAERAEEKKLTGGSPVVVATSPSPSDAAVPSSGSVN
jgi:hypothetical protein